MKFSILQQDLLPTLSAVARSVGARSTLPVLDNILLSVEGKNLKIAATNLEIGVIKNIPANVEASGGITLPAKTLVEIISGLSGQVVFETEGENATISSGKFKASINGISEAEFPAIPLADKEGTSFSKEVILSSAQILFSAAVDEGRPVLTGILTSIANGKLDFVATDGFRLAHKTVKLEGKEEFKSLIPRKTYEELLRIIAEEDIDQINVATTKDQNQAVFSLGKVVLSSRLIEGQFPAWEKIIPAQFVGRLIVDKAEMIRAVKLAAVFSKSEANIVVLQISKDGLNLSSSAKELGNQQNIIEANVEGEELTVAFNTRFLQDAINNIPTSQLMMEFSGPLSAAQVRPIGEEGLEFIVMPVRLN